MLLAQLTISDFFSNDHIAIVHADISKETELALKEVLQVEVYRFSLGEHELVCLLLPNPFLTYLISLYYIENFKGWFLRRDNVKWCLGRCCIAFIYANF